MVLLCTGQRVHPKQTKSHADKTTSLRALCERALIIQPGVTCQYDKPINGNQLQGNKNQTCHHRPTDAETYHMQHGHIRYSILSYASFLTYTSGTLPLTMLRDKL